jgi:hypothetical protein
MRISGLGPKNFGNVRLRSRRERGERAERTSIMPGQAGKVRRINRLASRESMIERTELAIARVADPVDADIRCSWIKLGREPRSHQELLMVYAGILAHGTALSAADTAVVPSGIRHDQGEKEPQSDQ